MLSELILAVGSTLRGSRSDGEPYKSLDPLESFHVQTRRPGQKRGDKGLFPACAHLLFSGISRES
jgi:hypothetical protein